MRTKSKKKPKILNIPVSKNKKHSTKGNSALILKKSLELSNKEMEKLLGSK